MGMFLLSEKYSAEINRIIKEKTFLFPITNDKSLFTVLEKGLLEKFYQNISTLIPVDNKKISFNNPIAHLKIHNFLNSTQVMKFP